MISATKFDVHTRRSHFNEGVVPNVRFPALYSNAAELPSIEEILPVTESLELLRALWSHRGFNGDTRVVKGSAS